MAAAILDKQWRVQSMGEISTPFSREEARKLRAGDILKINGVIYAARDAAHKRLVEMLEKGMELPFDITGQIVYYVGPCPAAPGRIIGSAGPTTSGRMDAYAPALIRLGLTGMIGKGLRSAQVVQAMKEYGAVYFGATGGAGALIAGKILHEEVVAFPELGPEAVRRLTVKDFPVTVIIDSRGASLYDSGKEQFRCI